MYAHVNIHGGHFRVLLDGVDVSSECQVASEERGYVIVLRRNARGERYVERSPGGLRRVARELRRGRVQVIPLRAFHLYTPAHLRRPLAPNY